ncbi:hypothetical protein OIN60_18860 [Paenibacillus sp. P96]|uniref:Uncharacterized protein n=1 Tax=Paenibacillus zeirhizosphaerae TaxID=2987519 RepID=A0ABT9FVN0_9BACL|nr:hypothetical protein [Paenibacillus sp. P96]MDP4098794.1 hypothetical protein [Paenibacillus sp. P96]
MDKLDLILQKLEALEEGQKALGKGQKTLEEGQKVLEKGQQALEGRQTELYQISLAIRDRQEETDAKLEAMVMDVHQLHGKIEAQIEKLHAVSDELHIFRRETKSDLRNIKGHMRLYDHDLDDALERIDQLESRQ